MHPLRQELRVLIRRILGRLRATTLQRDTVAFVLETLRSDETLDLGSFSVGFGAFLLGGDFASNNEFAGLLLVQGCGSVMLGTIDFGRGDGEGEKGRLTEHHPVSTNQRIV
jgi:hypothetical protein